MGRLATLAPARRRAWKVEEKVRVSRPSNSPSACKCSDIADVNGSVRADAKESPQLRPACCCEADFGKCKKRLVGTFVRVRLALKAPERLLRPAVRGMRADGIANLF